MGHSEIANVIVDDVRDKKKKMTPPQCAREHDHIQLAEMIEKKKYVDENTK